MAERQPNGAPRARTRNIFGLTAIAAVALAVPLGHYAPYSSHALRETSFARACHALPVEALARVVGARVRAPEVALRRVRAEVENLFPAVSRTACEYEWKPACTHAARLRGLSVIVAALPNASQALYRYSYTEEMLHQDSYTINAFNTFQFAGHRAYELTIGNEVLVRVLDRDYVIDMKFHLCSAIAANAAQATARPIAHSLRLPILAGKAAPSAPRAEP